MQAECTSLRKGLQNTKLGWIIAGKISERAPTSSVCAVLTEGEKVDEQLAKFWELDNFQPGTNSVKTTSFRTFRMLRTLD